MGGRGSGGDDSRSVLVGGGGGGGEGDAGSAPGGRRPPRKGDCKKGVLLRSDFELQHSLGSMRGRLVLAPGDQPRPTVVVNACCYTSLPKIVEGAAPLYATRGYAFVLVWQDGPKEEVADRIFERWRADAEAVLDWLAEQPWCDGRIGTHGMSLLGTAAYSLAQVANLGTSSPSSSGITAECPGAGAADTTSGASSAPAGGAAGEADRSAKRQRMRVCALAPSLSFSRVHPTVFLWGQGVAAELVVRFLWLAELGAREGEFRGPAHLAAMFRFFGLSDFPGLFDEALKRPVLDADKAMWGRRNVLWRNALANREESAPFWTEGRDKLCDLAALAAAGLPIRIVAGWWDMFLEQSLEDFAEAQRGGASGGAAAAGAQLVVYCGGHFGVAGKRAKDIEQDTLAWYDKHVLGKQAACESFRRPVTLEIFGAQPTAFVELDAWPPAASELSRTLTLFARAAPGTDGRCRLGSLSEAPAPKEAQAAQLTYVYDPRQPTPYCGAGWLNSRKEGPRDQRAVEKRSDVLVLSSEPYDKPFDIVGVVKASLLVECSAPECDVVVRLCVVRAPRATDYLDIAGPCLGLGRGRSLNICEKVRRVSFAAATAGNGKATAGTRVDVDVGPACCRIRRGDRLRLQVCSAAHPKVLRHPLHEPGEDWLGQGEVGPPATLRLLLSTSDESSASEGGRQGSTVSLPVLEVSLSATDVAPPGRQ